MDIPRVGYAKRKRARQIAVAAVAAAAVAVIGWVLSRFEPAAPSVDAALVVTDTVARGEMVRRVRGTGTLVPETVVVIAATNSGRVQQRLVQPGQAVRPGTVLLVLSSPQVDQEYLDAAAQLREAQADLANLEAQLEDQRLTQESVTADLAGQHLQAKAQYEADLELSKLGLIDQVTLMKSRIAMQQLEKRHRLEQARENARKPSVEAQIGAQKARIEQMNSLVTLHEERVDQLRIRADMDGVLQLMDVEVGQLVAPGDELARVSDPKRLKAELKVPETLVNDVSLGQKAEIDTRSGVIEGRVSRIDPGAVEGTVLVDVELLGELPRSARPDLSIVGTVEVERLEDVLHVGRPIYAREDGAIGLFRLEEPPPHASRVQVEIGKVSVSTIEVRAGLREGDQVILSDMSAWDEHDRIRLE